MEFLSAASLATAAGLNAYVPLLVMGLLARFTNWVVLPAGWTWLSTPWVLGLLAVLLLVEVVADKVPAVDSLNDVVQTVVRPASGGIVFASGLGAQTVTVADPTSFFSDSTRWVPVVLGVAIALGVHLLKAQTRPVANATTAGFAAPLLSTVEDIASLGLSLLALLLPVLALVAALLVVGGIWWLVRGVRRGLRSLRPASPE